MNKTALITGITGQDGSYLAKLLLEKGYRVCGISVYESAASLWRLDYLGILDKIELHNLNITDQLPLLAVVRGCKPEEIYHLAALTTTRLSHNQPITYGEVDGLATANLLETVRSLNRGTRVYLASSVEIFGSYGVPELLSSARYKPDNPYAIAKLYGYWMGSIYREGYSMYVCNGIMSNHESPLRGLDFVTRKISNEVARISLGLSKELVLGSIDARRNWGYAPDFVRAMWLLLQQEKPQDLIISTGEEHTVREFLEMAFSIVNLNWQDYVKYDRSPLEPERGTAQAHINSELHDSLGWKPEVKFDELVEIMVREDLRRWSRHLKGERFPWDISG
jgi:GDPmannose 4,6-dehydratase